ncbi:uncharacterized protein LOC116307380 [Actinia tenebrosa]|uniref:Uncharacterized protein LOC116307380 n=1 Tax=Actinia tenebrosa TaxID=6105 RepID=A0A6P8J1T0_ACTTE|nr:uncharacterized protein LOC116307380 [Actinia tenebrosa]
MRYQWIAKIKERTRRMYTLWSYYSNLWVYNTQKRFDAIWNGKPRETASVPFMITAKMRKSLTSLGYEERDVRSMTPQDACNIIKNQTKKS